MGDRWWSEVQCPECGELLSSQHWADKMYRLTSECGKSYLSGFSHGRDEKGVIRISPFKLDGTGDSVGRDTENQ